MKTVKTIEDVQVAVRDLHNRLQRFETGNINLNARRVINAGDSKDIQDYTTRREAEAMLRLLKEEIKLLEGRLQELTIRVIRLENP